MVARRARPRTGLRAILDSPFPPDGKPMFRNRILINYLAGIASIVIGAGLTDATDSMLPLAMGGAVGVMCTYSLVRAILQRRFKRTTKN